MKSVHFLPFRNWTFWTTWASGASGLHQAYRRLADVARSKDGSRLVAWASRWKLWVESWDMEKKPRDMKLLNDFFEWLFFFHPFFFMIWIFMNFPWNFSEIRTQKLCGFFLGQWHGKFRKIATQNWEHVSGAENTRGSFLDMNGMDEDIPQQAKFLKGRAKSWFYLLYCVCGTTSKLTAQHKKCKNRRIHRHAMAQILYGTTLEPAQAIFLLVWM